MKRGMRRVTGLLLALVMVLAAAIQAQGVVAPRSDSFMSDGADEYAFVRFSDPPIASYEGTVRGYAATKPAKGRKLDVNDPAARKYGERLTAQRENYLKWLARQYPQVEVVATYEVTYNGVGLKLNGATLEQIRRGPGAVESGYSGTYFKAMSNSHELIGSAAIWSALGGADGTAGGGIKVGIIDSGIDQAHEFLGSGPAGAPYTSDKVIVAKVFHQSPWETPAAVDSHGTHVAGTVAGVAGTVTDLGLSLSGVAPGALLGNYNVFPGNTGSAKSLFIAKAVEEAVRDGMDVLNLSLGGFAHRGQDLLDMAVNAAVDAGVVVVIAAGNDGPGHYTVGSPGTAEKVITVAATTNSHRYVGAVASSALSAPTDAYTGGGAGELKTAITAEYAVWSEHAGGDKLACSPIAGMPLTGKIALIQRGVCTFAQKINNAAAAGADAVIIYQRDDEEEPFSMATDGVTIPAVMISRTAGHAMRDWTGDRTVTLEPATVRTAVPNLRADFSSMGPTPNYTLKPDVAAPGANIYSAVPGGGYEFWDGTSMATPHVAGAAALMIAYSRANGLEWSPEEIKARLMATGKPAADSNEPLGIGAGIIDLGAAIMAPAVASPASLSFGLVRPVGNHTYSLTFTLTNTTGTEQTYFLTDSAAGNLTFSADSVTMAAGQTASVTAIVADRGEKSRTQVLSSGYVNVTADAGTIRIPYLFVLDNSR